MFRKTCKDILLALFLLHINFVIRHLNKIHSNSYVDKHRLFTVTIFRDTLCIDKKIIFGSVSLILWVWWLFWWLFLWKLLGLNSDEMFWCCVPLNNCTVEGYFFDFTCIVIFACIISFDDHTNNCSKTYERYDQRNMITIQTCYIFKIFVLCNREDNIKFAQIRI